MAQMFNPAHPGRILREWLGEMQVSVAAEKLHVSRVTLSRILNGRAGISAEMSLRLSDALGTNPTFFIDLQTQYDLWQASRKRRPKIALFQKVA
jgi:addiction module HigA family antidote